MDCFIDEGGGGVGILFREHSSIGHHVDAVRDRYTLDSEMQQKLKQFRVLGLRI